MNNEIMFFIGVILGALIVLFEIVKLIKIDRIEKKYVKSIMVVCQRSAVDNTIRRFEARGWLTAGIEETKGHTETITITFIK